MIVSYTHSVIHAIQGQMLCTLKHFAFNRKKFLRNANRRTKRKDRYLLYVLINKTDLNLLNEFIHVGQHTDILISDLFQSACLRHKSLHVLPTRGYNLIIICIYVIKTASCTLNGSKHILT